MDGHPPRPHRSPRAVDDRGDHRGRRTLDASPPGAGPGALAVLSADHEAILTLVGKPDCGLCEEMKAVVQGVIRGTDFRLVEVDVRAHPDLEKRYVFEIPVLLRGDREIARHRVTEAELRERLRAPHPS